MSRLDTAEMASKMKCRSFKLSQKKSNQLCEIKVSEATATKNDRKY